MSTKLELRRAKDVFEGCDRELLAQEYKVFGEGKGFNQGNVLTEAMSRLELAQESRVAAITRSS